MSYMRKNIDISDNAVLEYPNIYPLNTSHKPF